MTSLGPWDDLALRQPLVSLEPLAKCKTTPTIVPAGSKCEGTDEYCEDHGNEKVRGDQRHCRIPWCTCRNWGRCTCAGPGSIAVTSISHGSTVGTSHAVRLAIRSAVVPAFHTRRMARATADGCGRTFHQVASGGLSSRTERECCAKQGDTDQR